MNTNSQPTVDVLRKRIDLSTPILGFYDAPDPALFEPLTVPKPGECVFACYDRWLDGVTLHLTRERCGCGGAAHWMWGIELRPRRELIDFLVGDEGLKATPALMERWVEARPPYRAEYPHLFIGPLKPGAWTYLRTATFLVNPDQLAALAIGAQYHSSPEEPDPVIAPFGSGCGQLWPFRDPMVAQAAIGSTDIASRQYLPADILAFTVTKPMFARLCSLDERSFLYKAFLQRLRKTRGLPDAS